jgi:hypothetical protein
MSVIKDFMKKMLAHLKENNEERIPAFKKNVTEMIKYITSKYDEFQFFTGESMDMDASLACQFMKEDSDTEPTLWFFLDALKDEKY